MNGPDAIYAGFADAVVPSRKLAALREALANARRGCDSRPRESRDRGLCDRRNRWLLFAGNPAADRCWFAPARWTRFLRAWSATVGTGADDAQDPDEKSPTGLMVTLSCCGWARLDFAGGMPCGNIVQRSRSSRATIFARAYAPQSSTRTAIQIGRRRGSRMLHRR